MKKCVIQCKNGIQYSCQGLMACVRNEFTFQIECVILLVMLVLAAWVAKTPLEYLLLIGSWLLVMVAELFNSAIEAVVDRISLERHPLSQLAKDYGSAGVFMCVIISAGCWLTVWFAG